MVMRLDTAMFNDFSTLIGAVVGTDFAGYIDIFPSLLFLVAALAGRKRILDSYRQAVQQGYRFFSYGDAMAIINRP